MIVWRWIPISARQGIRERWRKDRVPIFLFFITFVVMSYPFVFHMGDSVPLRNSDSNKALWQNWWLREALVHGDDVNFSPLIFHPKGLDTTFDPRRWSTFPLWTTLFTLFGDPLAFNLTAFAGILFKAYGMYLFALFRFQARIPAFVAGAFYAFAAPSLSAALQQPNTGVTEWIPWFMLFFARGLYANNKENKLRRTAIIMAMAGLCFSLNVYMNPKIGIFALIIGGFYLIWFLFAERLWLSARHWIAISVFAFTAAAASSPLLITMLTSDAFDLASERKADATK